MKEEENLEGGKKFCWSVAVQSLASRRSAFLLSLFSWGSSWARTFTRRKEGVDLLLEMVKVSCPFVLLHCFSLAFGQGQWLGTVGYSTLNVV